VSDREFAVRADGLVTGYHTSDIERAITTADFTWRAGRIVALIGPNGAGKSTLLRTLVGILPPIAGSLHIDDLPVAEYRRTRGIGYLPEALTLPVDWTGVGLLALGTAGSQHNWDRQVADALSTAGVDFSLDVRVGAMSKGMRQRLALALTLLPSPQLLLLDEPEAGLDPAQRLGLRERMQTFARSGRLVVVASHDVSGLCSIADDVWLVQGDGLLGVDPADLRDPIKLSQLFTGANR
jgi:ABC-type multidrug transport system ATPase subunit